MFHYRELNYNIIKVSERCLYYVIYHEMNFSFEESLKKIYFCQYITEIYKPWQQKRSYSTREYSSYEADLPTESVTELRQLPDFSTSQDESIHYGRESLVYLEPEIWEIIHKIRGLRESADTNLFIFFAWVVQSSAVTVLFS